MSAVFISSASPYTLELLPEVAAPVTSPLRHIDSVPTTSCYIIERELCSESACILFTRHESSSKPLVMKILREYKDTRYSLETVDKRQKCQLEALKRNSVFSPEVYLGLAPILGWTQGYIRMGDIIKTPTTESLLPNVEYALIMEQLPDDRRLDSLLQKSDAATLRRYLDILTQYTSSIHMSTVELISTKDTAYWGSHEQLEDKLQQNLELLDMVLAANNESLCGHYSYLNESISWLKKTLLRIFMQPGYRRYFEQRVQERYIRNCHGDIKSPNIWILPLDSTCPDKQHHCVKMLDAIDFNASFSNIDILSDFAMLIIDVQTRIKPRQFVNDMIDNYLKLTDQEDEAAKAVLGYYLVEKAIVGAAISILYDNLPDLGVHLLKVAQMRLNCLLKP